MVDRINLGSQVVSAGVSSDIGKPFFSVVIPTRNRPDLLRRALNSVLGQTFRDLEVLVVNDGSAQEFMPAYHAMEEGSDPRVSWHHQPHRANGHGPSYSINTGAQRARGQYLCILDDDDSWDIPEHLYRAWEVIDSSGGNVDAYYSNQKAYTSDEKPVETPMWLAILTGRLDPSEEDGHGTYKVTPAFLLSCNGFPHLNCTIIRSALYREIGGMDEAIRYECEVDLYLRTLDASTYLVFNPSYVARHNIPDAVRKSSVSTAFNSLQKRLSQITVYKKNMLVAGKREIRNVCIDRLSMLYRELAELVAVQGDLVAASHLARVALAYRASFKWHLYCIYLDVLAAVKK